MKVLLLSDTHGYLDERICSYASEADEIWHAGDFGNVNVSDTLSSIKTLRGVYGNIDGQELRKIHPEVNTFIAAGLRVMMIHIGGYPGHFPAHVRQLLLSYQPGLFICGHSHILKVTRDPSLNNMICMNPGAAGRSGFHSVRTMLRFEIEKGQLINLEVIELGPRNMAKT